jgi:hypothetical protein
MERGSKYHGQRVQNTMDSRAELPWVGVDMPRVGDQNTWIEVSKYHGYGVNIPWVGVQYTMDRGLVTPLAWVST